MHLVVRDIFNTLSHSICIMFLLFYDLHLFSAPWTEICKVYSKFLLYIMRQFLKGEARLLSLESQSGRLRLFQTLSVYECVSVSFYWCACFITLTLALNACTKRLPEMLCINSKYALFVRFQVGQMEWVSDIVSERRAGVVKFLFFWIIVTLRKKAKKIFRNDVITESIYIKSYCNQSGLSFNISTKFHQNLTHSNRCISR